MTTNTEIKQAEQDSTGLSLFSEISSEIENIIPQDQAKNISTSIYLTSSGSEVVKQKHSTIPSGVFAQSGANNGFYTEILVAPIGYVTKYILSTAKQEKDGIVPGEFVSYIHADDEDYKQNIPEANFSKFVHVYDRAGDRKLILQRADYLHLVHLETSDPNKTVHGSFFGDDYDSFYRQQVKQPTTSFPANTADDPTRIVGFLNIKLTSTKLKLIQQLTSNFTKAVMATNDPNIRKLKNNVPQILSAFVLGSVYVSNTKGDYYAPSLTFHSFTTYPSHDLFQRVDGKLALNVIQQGLLDLREEYKQRCKVNPQTADAVDVGNVVEHFAASGEDIPF